MDQRTTILSKTNPKKNLIVRSSSFKVMKWLGISIWMLLLTGNLKAQVYESLLLSDSIFNDTIDYVVISEWRGDSWAGAYTELTNMGDKPVDLRKLAIRALPGGKSKWDFDGPDANNETMAVIFDSLQMSVDEYTLDPGEIFLMAPHYDELTEDGGPIHRPELIEMADYIGYKDESVENDTTNYGERYFRQWGSYPVGLFVATRVEDTVPPFYKQGWVLVDNINGDRDPVTNDIGLGITAVAGFPDATKEAVLVRKHTITKGTREGGWTDAASDDISTSEWIPIKHDDSNPGGKVFKTAGNHGNFTMDVTAGNGAVIDLGNGTLEVPWGAIRGEEIIDNEVLLGDGMAWTYQNYSEEGDSLLDVNDLSFNKIAMPGDVLKLYACGDDLETVELTISYTTYASDIVKVYPTYKKNEIGEWIENYYVTEDEPVIDTIGNVPYATRIDTLLSYLDLPPNASYEFVLANGEERADLRYGDKLIITGEDGSTVKEYFIDVQEYAGGNENRLAAITWPDIYLTGEDIAFYLQNGWSSGAQLSDTIPGFSPSKLTYLLKLAPGTQQAPAIVATPLDQNAYISMESATNITGTIEQRTTTITVTSEDSSSVLEYSILFEIQSDDFQKFSTNPFFSTLLYTINTRNAGIELVNPGNVPLDLSNYLVVQRNKETDPVAAIQDTLPWEDRYSRYIPGYVYKAKDTATWNTVQDYTWTKGGANIQSTISGGDVFVMANMHNKEGKWWQSITHTQEIDVLFHPEAALVEPNYPEKSIYTQEELDAPGEPVNQQGHVGYARAQHSFFLYKIENDSILAGTKSIHDTADFTLIDNIADPVNSPNVIVGSWDEYGDSARVWTIDKGNHIMVREPDIYKGDNVVGANINADHAISQWIVGDEDYWGETEEGVRWSGMTGNFGTHTMDPPTVYVSTVNSYDYIISPGYEGLQTIKGVIDGTTVEQFLNNIIKSDPEQKLKLVATADGSELGLSDVLYNSDTLIVTAADSSAFTEYVLEVTAEGLKSNAKLTSSVYTINESGETGTIVDVPYGTTVKDVLENVAKDVDANLIIINGDHELLGLNRRTSDGDIVLRTASSDVYFEVTAQDKVTKITYQVVPDKAETDAYILSDVYDISEWNIDGLTPGVSVTSFFENIIVVGGEAHIIDKMGFERSIGLLSYDDSLVVVSDNGTISNKYTFGFTGVVINHAPVVELTENVNAVVGESFLLSANVTDDNLPAESSLSFSWMVTSGSASEVTIDSPDAASTNVTISSEGAYELTLTVSDGELETTASVSVTAAVGGIDQHGYIKLNIYPNPATEVVFIEGLMIHSKVAVYNLQGKIVDSFDVKDGRQNVNLKQLPSGTYIIKVDDGQSLPRIGKVVKR